MSTSIHSQRGTQYPLWRRLSLPLLAGALTLTIGCGGGGGGVPAGEDDGGNAPEGPPAPTVTAVNPTTGSPQGGTNVMITGSGFLEDVTGATSVTFGGLAATGVVVVDDTTISAVTPAGVDDTIVVVQVENSSGIGALGAGFHYLATAEIISDLNSDGFPDVVIAAPRDDLGGDQAGTVYIFYGVEDSATLGDAPAVEADVTVTGIAAGDKLGTVIASGDVNGDGHDDLLTGAPYADQPSEDAGVVAIFFGPLPEAAQLDLGEADVILSGEGIEPGIFGDIADHFGTSLSLGDVDGDGLLDILVGAPGADAKPGEYDPIRDAGRAYLFLGSDGLTDTSAADALVTIVGVKSGRNLGSAVSITDVNADGLGDLTISEAATWSSHSFGGHVYVFLAGDLESGTGQDADLRIMAEANGDMFGASITGGDFNGDGVEDLMVGAPEANITGYSNGCVYVFLGHPDFDVESADDADIALSGYFSNTSFGSNIACADMNGDGFGDVMVGAPRYSSGASRNGRVFVFLGTEDPMDELADFCDVIYTGEESNNGGFGSSVEVLDCDGDGMADVMSSATGIESSAGKVYLFRGKDLSFDASATEDDRTLSGDSDGDKFGSAISRGK